MKLGKHFTVYSNYENSGSKHLLLHTDKNITSISTYLGFSSQSHFCRVFKSKTGTAPLDYKSLNKGKKRI